MGEGTTMTGTFAHPDYSIGCGGFEEPMRIQGKTYLYVWNRIKQVYEYYVFENDEFISDKDAPWHQD
jgi:hypothetical protein